jgi:TolB protein
MDLWQQPMRPDGTPKDDPRPVTAGIGMRRAKFSPDGTKLAYSRGRRVANLWRVPILEDRPATWLDAEQLTFDQAYIEAVDVSRDGERLVFMSDRSGHFDIWTLSLGGGEMAQVTSDPTPDWWPKWSPDGAEIAFQSYRSGNREIWVIPMNGGPARQLTDGKAAGVESYQPAWSPDGREIAFVSVDEGDVHVYIIPREGGEARQLTNAEEDWQPGWSPDGEWIVLQGGGLGLRRVPTSGGEPEFWTDAPYAGQRWSRDGQRVFFSGRGETAGNVWAVSVEDRAMRAMTDLAGRSGTLGNRATDGRYLYFAWQEDLGDIWVMDVATDN